MPRLRVSHARRAGARPLCLVLILALPLLAAACLCADPAPRTAPPSSNLLLNGSFEESDAKKLPESWVMRNLTPNSLAKAELRPKAFSGKQCLMLEGLTFPVYYGAFSRPVDVSSVPGGHLIFSCYYRTEEIPQADISITTFNTDFTQNEWKTPPMQAETRPVPQSKDWSLLSWQFDCQPGVKHAVVTLHIGGRGRAFFDGAALRAYPSDVACTISDPGIVMNVPDRRSISLQLKNNTDTRRKVRVVALAHIDGKSPAQAAAVADIDPRAKGSINLDYRYDARLAHQLRVMVLGEDPTEVFDHQTLEVPGLVAGRIVTPAFRGTILSTLPGNDILAEGYVNAPPEVAHSLTFEARLMGTGQRVAPGGKEFEVAPNGTWRVSLPAEGMLAGSYTVRVTAKLRNWEGSLDLPLRKAPNAEAEAGYDRQGRLWLAGKPLFPIGVFYALSVADVPKVAAAGFNFIINPSRAVSYDYADRCKKAGIAFAISSASLEDSLWRNMTEKFGNHPAFLGWYTVERPDAPPHLTPASVVKDLHDRLAAIDPHHPVLMSVAAPSVYSDYFAAADIPLVWTDVIPTAPVSAVGVQVETAVRAAAGRTPVWAAIQATGRGYATNKELDLATDGRPPTPAEYRAMVYEAIVRGASGIVAYAYTIPQDRNRRQYQIDADAPQLWEAVKATNSELAWLGPVFATAKRTLLPSVGDGHVEMASWTTSAGNYLVAVNTSSSAAVTVFSIPGCAATKLDVLFEGRRIGGTGGGAFGDSFEPNQVHVYCWK